MTLQEALEALGGVEAAMREQFPDAVDRLHQLGSHMATVKMVVEHLHDEAARSAPAA